MTYLDPKVWGPHYWFFLHTLSMTYPVHPNAVSKKKYYDFIQSLPLFIPVESISSEFSKLLNMYPITPYLDNRESFIRWMHFIHNKINEKLEKPQMKLNDFYVKYYEEYKNKDTKIFGFFYKLREKIIYSFFLLIIVYLIYYLYDK
jgi:hypothetical protein